MWTNNNNSNNSFIDTTSKRSMVAVTRLRLTNHFFIMKFRLDIIRHRGIFYRSLISIPPDLVDEVSLKLENT